MIYCYIFNFVLIATFISFYGKFFKRNNDKIFFSKTYYQMWYEIANQIVNVKSKISLSRYGDGEYSILLGKPFNGKGNIGYKGGKCKLRDELLKSLKCPKNGNCFYGVWLLHLYEFLQWSNQSPQFFTTSNIFCNKNYPKTKLLFESLIHDEKNEIILFCNKKAKNVSFAKLVYYFPDNIANYYEKNYSQLLKDITYIAKKYTNHLFMLSIGPLAPVLIYHMRLANINNRYIDFGSTMDQLIKGSSNRNYLKPNSSTAQLIDNPFKIYNNEVSFLYKQ